LGFSGDTDLNLSNATCSLLSAGLINSSEFSGFSGEVSLPIDVELLLLVDAAGRLAAAP
jgi:hypothetical protein